MPSILYDYTPAELQTLLDNSESYSQLLRSIGLNPKGGNPETLKRIIKEYNLDETQLNMNRSRLYRNCAISTHSKTTKNLEDILSNKVSYKNTYSLLKRLFSNGIKEKKCERCGLTDWMGEPISLQLHHNDGNRDNNSLENLSVLCPNCHSQTDSYAGKNTKKRNAKLTIR